MDKKIAWMVAFAVSMIFSLPLLIVTHKATGGEIQAFDKFMFLVLPIALTVIGVGFLRMMGRGD
ncbi:hypothetical protein JD969_15080 [Planctomycetota bacterium]|nr:hypothetical protein JD969_15080 [Planctomycetota bacterium]